MLSSVCGGASRGSRRCTCRLRSQHKLSECLSGSECVVLHFEHLEIGGRGELISYEHLYTQCHHPTLGLDVRNGRFVQSPEVGLRSYSCVFPYRRDLLRGCRLVLFVLTTKCVIFASCPHHCCFVIRLLFASGSATASVHSVLKAVTAAHIPLRLIVLP